ncbi:MAG TPA: NUDIX domain-containing protein [Pseudonocardiaceae bacterium]|nr:NUDIX domain-containing protein [Pseudonocardiaceae bacterium]
MNSAEEIQDALRRFPRRGIRRWASWRGGFARAAVAITVVTSGSGLAVLLTRRAGGLHEYLGQHAYLGQHVLPGLCTDPRESAPAAARRALAEDFGMLLPPESVLGLLDDYETRSNFVITPVVVWAGARSEPQHSRNAQVLTIPFADLDVEPMFVASAESGHSVIRLPLHGEWLHAPTAAVLYQFREVVLRHRRTRVVHLAEGASAPCEC